MGEYMWGIQMMEYDAAIKKNEEDLYKLVTRE